MNISKTKDTVKTLMVLIFARANFRKSMRKKRWGSCFCKSKKKITNINPSQVVLRLFSSIHRRFHRSIIVFSSHCSFLSFSFSTTSFAFLLFPCLPLPSWIQIQTLNPRLNISIIDIFMVNHYAVWKWNNELMYIC